ncbi:hypothetical protein HOD20_00360 [archaeon]|nr:hypothetical protein [archaeon]
MINSKRGVESVEVWMWVIAGLIIGTIVFGGSYMLFSHWIENNELKETKVNFELLTQSIVKTCNQGTDKLEISRFVFPPIVKNITIKNKETNEEGIGFLLCIQFENEELCKEIDSEKYGCDLPVIMQSINMGEKKGLFYVIQKAMKKSKAKNVDFEISKTVEDNICVHWDIKDEDSDIGVKPDLLNEGEQCTSTCYCGDKLLCDEFGYCCPEKHYFDGSQCVPYKGDGMCQIYIEENCEEEPNDCACSNNQCCYGCKNSDEQGCCPVDTVVCDNTCIEKPTQPKQPEDKCKCDAECGSNLKCEDRHCICEDGFTWNKETKKCEEPSLTCDDSASLGYLVEYAHKYVGCPYDLNVVKQSGPEGCRPVGLTCATFVSSVVIGKTSYSTFYGHGYQKCTVNVNEGRAKMLGNNVEKLEPGDVFQAGGSPVGHTGMYVGKGKLSKPESYFGIRTCYRKFECDSEGEHIFIHSIGNSNGGQPGVCYESYKSLFNSGRYNNYQFCRVKA